MPAFVLRLLTPDGMMKFTCKPTWTIADLKAEAGAVHFPTAVPGSVRIFLGEAGDAALIDTLVLSDEFKRGQKLRVEYAVPPPAAAAGTGKGGEGGEGGESKGGGGSGVARPFVERVRTDYGEGELQLRRPDGFTVAKLQWAVVAVKTESAQVRRRGCVLLCCSFRIGSGLGRRLRGGRVQNVGESTSPLLPSHSHILPYTHTYFPHAPIGAHTTFLVSSFLFVRPLPSSSFS